MATREADRVTVSTDRGEFDRFSSVEVENSFDACAAARFRLGDDGAWAELEDIISPGVPFEVRLNGALRLTGRAEVNEVDAGDGTELVLTVRGRSSDARAASAAPGIAVEGTSIRDFLLAIYAPVGVKPEDFVFAPDVARDLMTGRVGAAGPTFELEPLKIDQAKVQPPETIDAAAERHLRRHQLMRWDSPDGKIVVGWPNVDQDPTYTFAARVGHGNNNVLSCRRAIDWSEAVSDVTAYGFTYSKDVTSSHVRGFVADADLTKTFANRGFFYRPLHIPAPSAKTAEAAQRLAQRELLQRSRNKDSWDVLVDGWTYWDGTVRTPYALGTVAELMIDQAGGSGLYLVTSVSLAFSVSGGCTTRLRLEPRAAWRRT